MTTVHGLRRQLLLRADVVIVCSRAEAAYLRSSFGIDDEKMGTVHAGTDCERFHTASADAFKERYGLENFVLQVGRVKRDKGQSRLIRALDGMGLDLVIIGPKDPTDPRGVLEFDNLLRGRARVHYLGPLPHHDPLLRSAFKAARVHALPSSFESLGFVTLEAAAAGCAIVTGAYRPIVEYLGNRAYYWNPQSEASIRTTLEKAYKSGPELGLAEFVRQTYSWDSVALELKNVYSGLLEKRRGGPG